MCTHHRCNYIKQNVICIKWLIGHNNPQVLLPNRKTGGNVTKKGVIMRQFIGFSILALGLTACTSTQPNDGDQYFDKITPDPAALERTAAESRLKQAEGTTPTGETVTVDLATTKSKPVEVGTEGDGSISNSQNFKVVKANETIASDAAKLAELKQSYEIVQPGATPTRGSGINLAKYALAQTNPVGQKAYSRSILTGRRAAKKCAAYGSADDAQLDFLRSGGPQSDRRGIDPDGDGYACSWSPDVFRSMLGQQ